MVPTKATRVRRDFGTLLNLISASAILHQKQRGRTEAREIIATIEDYRIVRGPLASVFSAAQDSGVTPEVRETVKAVHEAGGGDGVGVSVTRIAKQLGLDKGTVSRRVAAAIKADCLEDLDTRKGVPSKIVVIDRPDEKPTELPAPEAIGE